MAWDLFVANVFSPPVLFFGLGLLAVLVRAELKIPPPIPTLFSLYLLWAIGYRGGVELHEAGFSRASALGLGAAVLLSALTPLWVRPLLRVRLNRADASAAAAAFGSVSAVTFITAANFLNDRAVPFGGHMVAALALMEAPAIVVGVLLHRWSAAKQPGATLQQRLGLRGVLREAVLSGPVFLLLGSLAAGLAAGPRGYEQLRPFTTDVFYGVLVLFLLDSGMTAAKRLGELRAVGLFALAASVGVPLVNAALAWGISAALSLGPGDAFLLMVLAASASYIAVPAAMRLAIPEANAGVYLPMALGITFPFNVSVGIPLYMLAARTLE